MNQTIDINTLTVDQLKAIAYDAVKMNTQAQQTINAIEAELQKRASVPKEVEQPE